MAERQGLRSSCICRRARPSDLFSYGGPWCDCGRGGLDKGTTQVDGEPPIIGLKPMADHEQGMVLVTRGTRDSQAQADVQTRGARVWWWW